MGELCIQNVPKQQFQWENDENPLGSGETNPLGCLQNFGIWMDLYTPTEFHTGNDNHWIPLVSHICANPVAYPLVVQHGWASFDCHVRLPEGGSTVVQR